MGKLEDISNEIKELFKIHDLSEKYSHEELIEKVIEELGKDRYEYWKKVKKGIEFKRDKICEEHPFDNQERTEALQKLKEETGEK